VTREGDRSRCATCGGTIVAVKDRTVISLTAGRWIHAGAIRRALALHPAVPV
jgi:hypothetical protein